MRWQRFSMKTIFLVIFLGAVFFTGYHLGFSDARDREWIDAFPDNVRGSADGIVGDSFSEDDPFASF